VSTTVNIHDAKTHLSRLLERVQRGERIVIAKAGRPIAELVRVEAPGRRVPGHDRVVIHDDFDAPLPEFAEYTALMGPPDEGDG
jgi:prevent-host-death family protein